MEQMNAIGFYLIQLNLMLSNGFILTGTYLYDMHLLSMNSIKRDEKHLSKTISIMYGMGIHFY